MRTHLLAAVLLVVPLDAQEAPSVSVELADRPISEVLDAAAAALGWNVLYNPAEMYTAKRRTGEVPDPDRLELPRAAAESVLARWLLDHDLALVPLVREQHLYLAVGRNGPRRGLFSQRATELSPQDALALRESGSCVWTAVPLANAQARTTAKALEGDRIDGVAIAPICPREAILVLGPNPDVARIVERIRALDQAAGAQSALPDGGPKVQALLAEITQLEQRVVGLEQRRAAGVEKRHSVLSAGEHNVEELLRAVSDQLDWSMLAHRSELPTAGPSSRVRLQCELRLSAQAAPAVFSQLLLSAGFAMTTLDRTRDLYEIIRMNGPRRQEINLRAEPSSVDEVLASRTVAGAVTVVVPLRHCTPGEVMSSFRPLLTSLPGVSFSSSGQSSVMLLQGQTPAVAMVVDMIAEVDQPRRGSATVGAPGIATRIAGLRRRVAALESKPREARQAEAPADGRFTLPQGELSLKSLLVAAQRGTGVPFRVANEDSGPGIDAMIVLPHELSCERGKIVPLVAALTAVFGQMFVTAADGKGHALLPQPGPSPLDLPKQAQNKTANEVLALRAVPVPVRTEVQLRSLSPSIATSSLRPLFAGNGVTPMFGGITPMIGADHDRWSVMVTALAPHAARIVELLRAWDGGGAAANAVVEPKQALARLRARLNRLE